MGRRRGQQHFDRTNTTFQNFAGAPPTRPGYYHKDSHVVDGPAHSQQKPSMMNARSNTVNDEMILTYTPPKPSRMNDRVSNQVTDEDLRQTSMRSTPPQKSLLTLEEEQEPASAKWNDASPDSPVEKEQAKWHYCWNGKSHGNTFRKGRRTIWTSHSKRDASCHRRRRSTQAS